MRYTLQFRDVFAAWDLFLDGVLTTLALSFLGICGGLVFGTAFAALRISGPSAVRRVIAGYVDVIRNTPLLVQLFLIFFGLPSFGIRLAGFSAAIIALVIHLTGYVTEIVRAGLEAVPRTQREAGASLGLSGLQVFRHVILLPALRAMFPALASQFVFFMLSTAAVSQIAVSDLFYMGSLIQSRTYRDFEVYIVVGVLYLLLAFLFRGMFHAVYRISFSGRQ